MNKFLLFLVIVIAVFLRFFLLPDFPPGLFSDEAVNGNNALEALKTGDFKFFYPENFGREGLFINIQALSVAVFGNEAWALRLVSAIFGVLTVLGVYFLTKELFNYDTRLALLASFLIATSFWHINFSRIGFRAIMAPFFLTWGVYFLLLSFRKVGIFLPLLAGLVYGLGFHSYIAYRATPLFIGFVFLLLGLNYGWKTVFKKAVLFGVAVFIAVMPLALHFINNPDDFFGRTTQISVFSSPTPLKDLGLNILKTAGMFNFVGDWNWRHNIAGRPLLFWPVGIFFAIGALYGLRHFKKFEFLVLFSWLAVVALPVVISNEGLPHALRSLLMIPPVFILAAIGGVWLYGKMSERVSPRLLSKFVFYVFLPLLVFEAYVSYFITWGQNPSVAASFDRGATELAYQLRDLPKETAKYVILKRDILNSSQFPISINVIQFLTDTYLGKDQADKNLHYLLEGQAEIARIPKNALMVLVE